jgi:hypothetical protein
MRSPKQQSRMRRKARRRYYLGLRDKMHAARTADDFTRVNAVMAYAYRVPFARGLFPERWWLRSRKAD